MLLLPYSCSQYTYYMYYHTPTACYMALTCCDLVTPDGDIGLGQHWLRHITWINAHFSLERFYEIQLEAILQRLPKQLFSVMSFENYAFKIIATSLTDQWVNTTADLLMTDDALTD